MYYSIVCIDDHNVMVWVQHIAIVCQHIMQLSHNFILVMNVLKYIQQEIYCSHLKYSPSCLMSLLLWNPIFAWLGAF